MYAKTQQGKMKFREKNNTLFWLLVGIKCLFMIPLIYINFKFFMMCIEKFKEHSNLKQTEKVTVSAIKYRL